MKPRYTFGYIDIFSVYTLISFLVFVIFLFFSIRRVNGGSGFLAQSMLNVGRQPVKVQLLIIKIQKLLRWLAVVNVVLFNFFLFIVTVFYGIVDLVSQVRQHVRVQNLTTFNDKLMLEVKEQNLTTTGEYLFRCLSNIDKSLRLISSEHAAPTYTFLGWSMTGLLIVMLLIGYWSGFFSKPIKLSLLLIVRVDFFTLVVVPFLFTVVVLKVNSYFQTFFVRQFLFFFASLRKSQKIKFLKNLYLLLVGSLVINIMFPIFVIWAFFYSQIIEVAQIHHLYEADQLLYSETQTILSELIEKQKLYLPDTVEYQNITNLINFTNSVIDLQEITREIFEFHYSFSIDQVSVLSFKYVIVVRILMLVLFGLSFLILAYSSYKLFNIKK